MSNVNDRLYARESLIYNVTEDLLVIMEDKEISKSELARKLGKSRSYVTQVLSGARNMTLGSLSDFCFALEIKPEIYLPVKAEAHHDEVWHYRKVRVRPDKCFHGIQIADKVIFESGAQDLWNEAV